MPTTGTGSAASTYMIVVLLLLVHTAKSFHFRTFTHYKASTDAHPQKHFASTDIDTRVKSDTDTDNVLADASILRGLELYNYNNDKIKLSDVMGKGSQSYAS